MDRLQGADFLLQVRSLNCPHSGCAVVLTYSVVLAAYRQDLHAILLIQAKAVASWQLQVHAGPRRKRPERAGECAWTRDRCMKPWMTARWIREAMMCSIEVCLRPLESLVGARDLEPRGTGSDDARHQVLSPRLRNRARCPRPLQLQRSATIPCCALNCLTLGDDGCLAMVLGGV